MGPRSTRSGRTANQWINSVLAYLEWRSGNPWRQLSDPEQRNDQNRWDYMAAAKLVRDARYAEVATRPRLALPVLNPKPRPTAQENALAAQPRSVLVAQLVASGEYTDAKLLSHLSRPKLAGMAARVCVADRRRA